MRISPIAALAAVAVTAAALASCSGPGPAALPGSADQQPAARGPAVTLREAVHRYRSSLVPLSTLGGVGGGVNTFEDQWLPWIWQPAYHAGQAYAIGAETGPLALCYRPQLLTEAGLPSSPARLARDWSTWQGYLAFGREFRQRIPRGPAFMDSVTSVYDAMVSQAGPAPAGQAAPASQGAPAGQAAPSGP